MSLKNGALIALAAGSLFAAACKKKDEGKAMENSMDKPMAGEMKSETEMKSGDMKASSESDNAMAKPDMAGESNKEKMAAKVHCSGVNACKGHGACKSEANACSGKNGCKGHGWVELTEDECKAKGGSVVAAKM